MESSKDDPYGGDALLRECVESAMAPHVGRMAQENLDAMRDYLIVFVTTHPAAEPLYARLRSRPPAERSALVEQHRSGRIALQTAGATSAGASSSKKAKA